MHTHAKTKNNNGNKKQTKQNNNNNINDNISKFSCKCFFFPFFQTDVPVYFVHFSSFMAKFSRPPNPGLFAWLQKLHTIDLSSRVRLWLHCLKPMVNFSLELLQKLLLTGFASAILRKTQQRLLHVLMCHEVSFVGMQDAQMGMCTSLCMTLILRWMCESLW